MKAQAILTFPGGSKSKVNKAGVAIAEGNESPENLKIFEDWRAAHRGVLNTFQAILRTRAKNKNVIVAQRHKRKATILDKLHRHKGMALAQMGGDTVSGVRDDSPLAQFREDGWSVHYVSGEIRKVEPVASGQRR